MSAVIERIFNHRLRALIQKEFGQIRRDRRLALSLVVPPTLQLLLLGFALSASVSNVKLGAVDDSRTPESRELIAVLSESRSFHLVSYYASVNQLGDAISRGKIDAGVVISYDYARNLQRGRSTTVQFLLNAMNANTAAISQGLEIRGFMRALGGSHRRRSTARARCSCTRLSFITRVSKIPGLL